MLIKKTGSVDQTQLDSASENEKNEPIRSNIPLCLFHVQFKRSCYLTVIGGFRSVIFFVAEKPLPMTRTRTVVNFHNFHGQCGSLDFEQTESSD